MKEIFFAYESGHQENIDAIKKAIHEYNTHQSSYKAKTWEELGVSGKIINKTILNAIDKCEIFACDMTYINHNVLFELGYAIGKEKKLLIFLNGIINGAESTYSSFKILKNVGYEPFNNYKEILSTLQKHGKTKTVILEQLINVNEIDKDTFDILYISSKINSQASLELTEMLKQKNLKIIFDNTTEVEYQTLIWYIKSLLQAKNIVIHLSGRNVINNYYDNAESSLYAGIGCGLEKKVLLIAPTPFRAPIDYTDILIEYDSADDCVLKTEEWIERNIKESLTKLVEEGEISSQVKEEMKLNLLKLGIGCEIAEHERDDLLNYFIEIDAYHKALNNIQSIFIGSKGTGKSAIFIKLEDELCKDKRNYNIILKPDSFELLENIEMSKLYNSETSKKRFFYNVWSFIFFSKLFSIILERIKGKYQVPYEKNSIEDRIIRFNEENSELIDLNFFGAIKKINKLSKGRSLMDDPKILEDFNKKILGPLKRLVKEYFSDKKYFRVYILADNLDKTWEAKNLLEIQSEMILSLQEFSERIVNEIVSRKTDDVKVNTIIFLRKDIFDYILRFSREPDKLTTRSYEIDWNEYPNLLKKLIDKRIEFILDLQDKKKIEKVWGEYFNLNANRHPFEIIKDIITIRPRDIIYFIGRLFESAVNKDHNKVNNEDLKYAIEAYTIFLHNNLIAEMKAEFPDIEIILMKLQETYGQEVDYYEFKDLVTNLNFNLDQYNELLDSLFNKNYIIGFGRKGEKILDLKTLEKRLRPKFKIFKRGKTKLVVNPDVYQIKHKGFK